MRGAGWTAGVAVSATIPEPHRGECRRSHGKSSESWVGALSYSATIASCRGECHRPREIIRILGRSAVTQRDDSLLSRRMSPLPREVIRILGRSAVTQRDDGLLSRRMSPLPREIIRILGRSAVIQRDDSLLSRRVSPLPREIIRILGRSAVIQRDDSLLSRRMSPLPRKHKPPLSRRAKFLPLQNLHFRCYRSSPPAVTVAPTGNHQNLG